ncbi:PQQ-binding-like beta-propeller repeat protein [Streptosporangium canum]|uniref:outer membrane protein assembly factor BamB family protein n=1 Tax=Streptosporangium canum TaxID=324952 RepID=UPI0036A3D941
MLIVRDLRVLAILLALAVCPVVAGDAPRLPWAPAAWRTAWSMPDQERASFSLNNPRHGVAEGGLAVATPQGAVAVHDPRTGRRRYAIPADAVPTAGVWVAAGTIVVARQVPGEADHRLSGYELTDGAPLWRTTVTVEPVELVEGVPRYIGPRIMVTERGVTFLDGARGPYTFTSLDRPRGPYTFTSLELRTGRITARTVRPRDCLLHSAASARSVVLVSDCAGRIELASVDPHTLRPDWTRSLPPSGQADASLSLTAGADGYLDIVGGGVESFFAPDGRLLSTAREALARSPAAGSSEPERWSRPFRVGNYPELRDEGLLIDGRRSAPTFLISLNTVTGRIRALPIALPPTWPNLVGTTEDMAFVRDEAGWIVAYTLVHGPSRDPAPPGGAPLSDWPDACALLGDRALGALGGGYRPSPGRRIVAGASTPKPADCDWIPPTDEEAVVSVSVAWVFSTAVAARKAFAAIVGRVKQTGRYDPTTETSHALSQTLPRLPSGMLSESIVTAGPALVHLRSASRRAIRVLTPRLQRSLLARYEPAAVVPDDGPLAARPAGWSFPADGPIGDDLVVAGGLVHAGSSDGKVYALDAVSGALRWSHQTGGLVTSGPIRAGGTVYASTFSRIVALDAVSGRTRWSRRTPEASGFVIDGRTVYAWTGARVIALDAASGRTRWRGRASGSIRRVTPHAAGDLVYAIGPGGVVALDAGSGERRWRLRADGRTGVAGVATTADTVYVAAGDGRLHGLDRITGRPRWRSQIGAPILTGPLATGGAVYVGGGGVLHKLDAATGARLWTFEAGRGVHTTTNALMVARGVAYLARVGDRLHALDATTGRTRWTSSLGGGAGFRAPGPFTPVLAGDALYVAAGDGGLHALDAATGTHRWGFQTGGDIRSAPVVEGGRVYVGSANGNVYAIRASDGRVGG